MIVVKVKKVISGDCPEKYSFTAQFQYTDCRPFICTGFMQECPAKGEYFVLEDEKFINGDQCEFKKAIKLADYQELIKKAKLRKKTPNDAYNTCLKKIKHLSELLQFEIIRLEKIKK